jgi:ADP-ribose pyrophosphatase YjhB (NUDIX family)
MGFQKFVLGFVLKKERVLLIKKKKGLGIGRYNGFGGKVSHGESYEDALIREAKEELGLKIKNFELSAVLHFKDKQNFMVCPVYVIRNFEGQPTESEEVVPIWFDVKNIPYSQMWPDDAHWFPKVLEGKKVYGEFIFDEIYGTNPKLLDHKVKITSSLKQYFIKVEVPEGARFKF